MKRTILTTLLAVATIGVASANYETDKRYDLLYSDHRNDQMDVSRLPPTAAGKHENEWKQQNFGGMQDHPSERPSGI